MLIGDASDLLQGQNKKESIQGLKFDENQRIVSHNDPCKINSSS